MKKFRRIGILTSGGDAPGMNAAVRAVTRSAVENGVEVVGIYRGYSGLLEGDLREFSVRDVSNIINRGGTVLYSDRCPEMTTEEGQKKAAATCEKHQIDGIVAIGGDGTFRGAMALTRQGIPSVGLPGTIDNDIPSTDFTVGFDTAMNTVVEMVDRLRDTCESHARCNVVEVMGRHAGDIALQAGIASGATAVAIPEIPFDEDALLEKMKASRALGKRNFIVLVAEGYGHEFGPRLSDRINREIGIESRFACLAHVVRGGTPTLRDRLLATAMGDFAVKELLAGRSNEVICECGGNLRAIEIGYALTLDKMYKNKLAEGDLDAYTREQIEEMTARCEAKRQYIRSLYEMNEHLSL